MQSGARACAICGEPVPWRLSSLGPVAESALLVVAVGLLAAGLLVLRRRGGPGLAPDEALLARLPSAASTAVPTFTSRPPPTETLPPNTPIPSTATPLPEVITYTVASGDTLSGIAGEYGQTTDALLEANRDILSSPHDLSIGQQLRVPVPRSPEADVPAEAPAGSADVPSGAVEPPAVETLSLDLAGALGIPTLVATPPTEATVALEAAVPPAKGAARVAPIEPGVEAFGAPVPVSPADGATVTGEAPVLRWSSVGVLPEGFHYVIAIAEVGSQAEPRLIWVLTNATSVRVPGEIRPPLGTSRTYDWNVSVRRRTGRLIGVDRGEPRSFPGTDRTFVWAP